MSKHMTCSAAVFAGLVATAGSSGAFELTSAKAWLGDWTSPAARGTCSPRVGFSPEGNAAQLVADVIDHATERVHLAAYTFTSPDVVRRLIAAKRRGVDVAVLADAKEHASGRGAHVGQAALNLLVEAGIAVRTVSVYPIHHDKYIVADGETVETGSFNYTVAAARHNSENAMVIANCPSLAGAYEAHWQSRWAQGKPCRPSY